MELKVMGDSGSVVDWWFMYKVPSEVPYQSQQKQKRFKSVCCTATLIILPRYTLHDHESP